MEKRNGDRRRHAFGFIIPTIKVTDYDADLADQQKKHETKESSEHNHSNESSKPSSPNVPIVNESEEEDSEIIESLTKAHSSNFERHVDVDKTTASTIVKTECTEDYSTPETLTERQTDKIGMVVKEVEKELTDDDKADMEVSQLTSLLESKNRFVPLPGSISKLRRPTAKLVSIPPPGVLPDISDVNLPRYVPSNNGSSSTDSSGIFAEGHFEPLGEISFSVGLRFDGEGGLPNSGNRKTVRLYGESESDSHSNSPSSDEQPPLYWKLYDNVSSEKSDGECKDDIIKILNTFQVVDDGTVDDNISSTSNNLQKFNYLSKQSEEESKK